MPPFFRLAAMPASQFFGCQAAGAELQDTVTGHSLQCRLACLRFLAQPCLSRYQFCWRDAGGHCIRLAEERCMDEAAVMLRHEQTQSHQTLDSRIQENPRDSTGRVTTEAAMPEESQSKEFLQKMAHALQEQEPTHHLPQHSSKSRPDSSTQRVPQWIQP